MTVLGQNPDIFSQHFIHNITCNFSLDKKCELFVQSQGSQKFERMVITLSL